MAETLFKTDIKQTSIDAFATVVIARNQRIIYEKIREKAGSINEIADRLNWKVSRVSGRIGELRDLGLIEWAGENRNSNGRHETVWKATPGRDIECWERLI